MSTAAAPDTDRLPPADIDAEKCVLASMMLDPDIRAQILGFLHSKHFYQPDHQIIFRAIGTLHRASQPVDAILLRATLEKDGHLEQVGGTPYIAEILGTVPSAAHGVHYAQIVRERAIGRALISLATKYHTLAYEPEGHAYSDLARQAVSDFSRLTTAEAALSVVSIGEAAQQFIHERSQKISRRIETGLREIDSETGGFPVGGFTLIAGRPGMGKSQLAKQIAMNIGERGVPVGFISLEEGRRKIAGNLLANLTGIENRKMMLESLDEDDLRLAMDALSKLDRLPFQIGDSAYRISEIEAVATALVARSGCRVLIVDHVHLADAEKNANREQQIATISRSLKTLGKRLDVAMVALCQLNRGSESEADRPPVLRDLRDSGALEQDGDLILMLHRRDYYAAQKGDDRRDHRLTVHVRKNKDGALANIPLRFDGATQRISEWVPDIGWDSAAESA